MGSTKFVKFILLIAIISICTSVKGVVLIPSYTDYNGVGYNLDRDNHTARVVSLPSSNIIEILSSVSPNVGAVFKVDAINCDTGISNIKIRLHGFDGFTI